MHYFLLLGWKDFGFQFGSLEHASMFIQCFDLCVPRLSQDGISIFHSILSFCIDPILILIRIPFHLYINIQIYIITVVAKPASIKKVASSQSHASSPSLSRKIFLESTAAKNSVNPKDGSKVPQLTGQSIGSLKLIANSFEEHCMLFLQAANESVFNRNSKKVIQIHPII